MSWPEDLAFFSQVLDDGLADIVEGPMHHRRIRCSKTTEEQGEVENALIALEGSNPRKPSDLTEDELISDLIIEKLDAAAAALGAVEHLTGNRGVSARFLAEHCRSLRARAEDWSSRPYPQASDEGRTL